MVVGDCIHTFPCKKEKKIEQESIMDSTEAQTTELNVEIRFGGYKRPNRA